MFTDLPLSTPVVLAPMAGVTDAPFRRAVMRYGAGLVYSEMIASHIMVNEAERHQSSHDTLQNDPFPCAVQLAGCEPDIMAAAARRQEEKGAPLIDINFSCPVKKVVNGLGGSALMRDIPKARAILAAVAEAVTIPVSVKMRLGWDDTSLNAPELAKIAEDVGIKLITIHGRTRCQLYNGSARWDAVGAVKHAVHIPVLVNGDIRTPHDAKTALAQSGADGVMIARGAQGKPWVVHQIMTYLATGDMPPAPAHEDIGRGLIDQYNDMLAHYGPYMGNKIARKHIGWTVADMDGGDDLRARINTMSDTAQVRDTLQAFFGVS